MPLYRVQFVEGASSEGNGAVRFWGSRGLLAVEAPTRVEAYVAAYRALSARGQVTVLRSGGGEGRPLGFTELEETAVERAGAALVEGFPRTGVQIEIVVDDQGR